MEKKEKNFWWKKERKFTLEEVKELLEKIKGFNCGAIDKYLDHHVEVALKEWASEKGVELN